MSKEEGCFDRFKHSFKFFKDRFDPLPPYDKTSERKQVLLRIRYIGMLLIVVVLVIVFAVIDSQKRLSFINTYKHQPFLLPDMKICIKVQLANNDGKQFYKDLTWLNGNQTLRHFDDITKTPQTLISPPYGSEAFYQSGSDGFYQSGGVLADCISLGASTIGQNNFFVLGANDVWELSLFWAYIIGRDWTINWSPDFYQLAETTFGNSAVDWATASSFVLYNIGKTNEILDGVNTTQFNVATVPLYQLTFGSNVSCLGAGFNHPTALSADRCVRGQFKARIRVTNFNIIETIHESNMDLAKRIVTDIGSIFGIVKTILPLVFGFLITKLMHENKTDHIDHEVRESVLHLIAEYQRKNSVYAERSPLANVEAKDEREKEDKNDKELQQI